MAIRIDKGQTIDIESGKYDISTITIGLGWDIRGGGAGGFFSHLLGPKAEAEYDLDAVAFLLDEKGKVENLGNEKLVGGDIIFYNNLRHASGCVRLTGDNRNGEGQGDDEQIIVNLHALPQKYQKILFIVSIYKGMERKQHFGMLENAFIRLVDAQGVEMIRYDLSRNKAYNQKYSMIFAEVYRRNDTSWGFRAIGDPQEGGSFLPILSQYEY